MRCDRIVLPALVALAVLVTLAPAAWSQTAIETSFETGDGYPVGSVNSRPGWSVQQGSAAVTTDADYVEDGAQGLRVSTSGRLRVDHTAYSGTENGIGGIVYVDLWVNVRALPERAFTINGYDLYGGSRKRAFVIDFAPEASGADRPVGLGVARVDEPLEDALGRMLGLLGDPEAVRVLGPGRVREVLYAAVRGEAGTFIRNHLGGGQEIARVVGYVRDHVHEPISVDDLARRAGMSRSAFDRRFKEATTYAPLQFIKAMRLGNAALRLRQGASVGEAAYAVGYASASQFSREFRRHFGASPRAWGRAHEGDGAQSLSVPFASVAG